MRKMLVTCPYNYYCSKKNIKLIFKRKTIEKITNLINHEYIEGSLLFNKTTMQEFFYIFMKKNWIVKHVIIPINC